MQEGPSQMIDRAAQCRVAQILSSSAVISGITHNRVSHMGQMDSNLVGPTSFDLYFEKGEVGKSLTDAVEGKRGSSGTCGPDTHLHAAFWIAAYGIVNAALLAGNDTIDESQIQLLYSSLSKLL